MRMNGDGERRDAIVGGRLVAAAPGGHRARAVSQLRGGGGVPRREPAGAVPGRPAPRAVARRHAVQPQHAPGIADGGRPGFPSDRGAPAERPRPSPRPHARAGRPAAGYVVVASLMSLAYRVLPAATAAYRRRFPGIDLYLREGVQDAILADVRGSVADLGIGNVKDVTAPVVAEPLGDEACLLVLPRRHPFAGRRAVSIADLQGEPLISMPPESGLRRLIDSAALSAGVRLHHAITLHQFGTLFSFVRSGLGVAIVPASALPPRARSSPVHSPTRRPGRHAPGRDPDARRPRPVAGGGVLSRDLQGALRGDGAGETQAPAPCPHGGTLSPRGCGRRRAPTYPRTSCTVGSRDSPGGQDA